MWKAFWNGRLRPFVTQYLPFTLYFAGLLFLLYFIFRNYLAFEGFGEFSEEDIQNLSLVKLMMVAIGDSPALQKMAVSAGLILLWVLFFAIVRLGMKNLLRLKVFQFEVEVESAEKKIETWKGEVEGTIYPAKMMKFLSGEEVYEYVFDSLIEESLKPDDQIRPISEIYQALLLEYLDEMAQQYRQHYGKTFDYEIISAPGEKDLSKTMALLVNKARHSADSVFVNREADIWPKKNSFVHRHEFEDEEFFTILTSYAYAFRSSDDFLFSALHNIIISNIDRALNAITLVSIHEIEGES